MSGMYDTTATVYTKTTTPDDAGGYINTWTLLGTIQCRVWLQTDSIKEIGNVSDTAEMKYYCCCPIGGVAIGETDQIHIGTAIYGVEGIHTVAGHHRKMTLVEYKPE